MDFSIGMEDAKRDERERPLVLSVIDNIYSWENVFSTLKELVG